MSEYQHEAKNLPPGWDCKYDVNTGKCYYFNYLTKAMSLEDPRIRLRQRQQQQPIDSASIISNNLEQIPMQTMMHGSPYHVYPTNNHQAVQAFQGPPTAANVQPPYGASPLMAAKYQQLEMSPMSVSRQFHHHQPQHQHSHQQHRSASPHMPRIMSHLARQSNQHQQHHQQQQQLQSMQPFQPMSMAASLAQHQQETSFITAADTEAAVSRVNTMFPTANDDHIRLLMKKYHNREAVVISALQVEKHPIATPGPFATPPPPGRHATLLAAAANAFGINASTSTVHSMTPLLGGSGCYGGGGGHGGSRSSSRFAGIVTDSLLSTTHGTRSRTGSPVPSVHHMHMMQQMHNMLPARPASSCASVMTMNTTLLPHSSAPSHHASSQGIVAGVGGGGGIGGSPMRFGDAYRSSPKPHSSPKMKLRYLKSIYPKADEMLLLDTLANADNNVQHASEHLNSLGYEKRDTTVPKVTNRNREEQVMRDRQLSANTPPPKPKVRSNEEKLEIKARLQALYADVPGRIITMALESVDFSEDRACQILTIVMQDDGNKLEANKDNAADDGSRKSEADECDNHISSTTSGRNLDANDAEEEEEITTPNEVDAQHQRKSKRVRAIATSSSEHQMVDTTSAANMPSSKSAQTVADKTSPVVEFQSKQQRIRTDGPDAKLRDGPNESLLLADYVSWSGANPSNRVGHRSLARGPNPSLRSSATATAHVAVQAGGAKAELCKGAQSGLAKGSIYSQICRQMGNVKCN